MYFINAFLFSFLSIELVIRVCVDFKINTTAVSVFVHSFLINGDLWQIRVKKTLNY